MKILLLDNTNNVNFELALGFSKLGHQCVLILFQPGLLHDPISTDRWYRYRKNIKIYDLRKFFDEDIIQYTRDFKQSFSQIIRKSSAEIAIVNGIGIGLTKYLTCPWVIRTTGSDIHYYANENLANIRSAAWDATFRNSLSGRKSIQIMNEFATESKVSLELASGWITHRPGLFPETDVLFNSFSEKNNKVLSRIWMQPVTFNYKKLVINIFRSKPYIFINGARLDDLSSINSSLLSLDNKGTLQLLNAVKILIDQGHDFKLLIFKKGNNLEDVNKFIQKNNLTSYIIWKNNLSYKKLCFLFQSAKVLGIIDSVGTSCLGRISKIGYLAGKPVIVNTYGKDWKSIFYQMHNHPKLFSEISEPILHADSVQTICSQIKNVMNTSKTFTIKSSFGRRKIFESEELKKTEEIVTWMKSLKSDK